MKWILLSVLVIGILLLSACGVPTTVPEAETVPTEKTVPLVTEEEPAPPETPILAPATILLEFGELAADDEEVKWENELGRWKPATAVIDGEEKALTSRYFRENTRVTLDSAGRILLIFEWDEEGSKLSKEITSRLIGKPLAMFEGDEALRGEDGRPIAPIVQAMIVSGGVIMGLSSNDATRLSNQLNADR